MFKYIWKVILSTIYIGLWVKWIIEVKEVLDINRNRSIKYLLGELVENEYIVGWIIFNTLIIWLISLCNWILTSG